MYIVAMPLIREDALEKLKAELEAWVSRELGEAGVREWSRGIGSWPHLVSRIYRQQQDEAAARQAMVYALAAEVVALHLSAHARIASDASDDAQKPPQLNC